MNVPEVLPVGLSQEIAPLGYGGRLEMECGTRKVDASVGDVIRLNSVQT